MIALRQSRWFQGTLFTVLLGLGLALGACEGRGSGVSARELMFDIEPSRSTVLVGENVTILAYSEGTLGRDTQLEWDASGGELFTEDNGRTARVYFDEPGTYVVQSNLILDGRLARSASTTIEVQRIPTD